MFEAVPSPGIAYAAVAPAAILLMLFGGEGATERISVPPLLLLVVAWIVLTLAWTEEPGISAPLTMRTLSPLVGLAICGGMLDRWVVADTLRWTFKAVLVISAVMILLGIGTAAGSDAGVEGWRGLFNSKNILGGFCVWAGATFLAFETGRTRVVSLLLTAVLLVGSQSVTALMAGLIGLLCHAAIRSGQSRSRMDGDGVVVRVLVVGSVAILTLLVLQPLVLDLVGRSANLTGRTDIWAVALEEIGRRPLLGFGFEAFIRVYEPTEVSLRVWDAVGFRASHAHSAVIDGVGQIGVIGVLLVGAFLWQTFRRALLPRGRVTPVHVWIVVAFTAELFVSFAEAVLFHPWLMMAVLGSAMLGPTSDRDVANDDPVDFHRRRRRPAEELTAQA